MSNQTDIKPMNPSRKANVRSGTRHLQRGRVALASFGTGRLVGLAIGLLVLVAAPARATHVEGWYEGTVAQGGGVRFLVGWVEGAGISVNRFYALGDSGKGKTDLGQDCTPLYPPPADAFPIVDHAFSDTAPPFTVSGSFSEPLSASGTFRITTDAWSPPPGELPQGSTCDTGTVSWTASCSTLTSPCSIPPTFSGSASGAKVSTRGRVTFPLRIGCPPPGVDCRVSAAATARVPATAAAGRKQVKLGRSDYVVKVGSSAKARFKLTTKGRRLLRRLGRIKAKVEIAVTRAGSATTRTATVRLKAPTRTP